METVYSNLSSITYHESCPEELSLKPNFFSDDTYNEIRKWRRLKYTVFLIKLYLNIKLPLSAVSFLVERNERRVFSLANCTK
jgi:hypothetical protein